MRKKKLSVLIACLLSFAFVFGTPGPALAVFADGTAGEDEVSAVIEDETAELETAEPEPPAAETPVAPTETPVAPQATTTNATSNYEKQIATISAEIEALKGEKNAIIQNIDSVKGEKEKQIAVVNHIDQQMQLTSADIGLLEERMELLLLSITEKEGAIVAKQEDYNKHNDIFLQRARAMYMYDNSTTLGLVLGADSFTDFLTTTDMLVRVADHDQSLMENLEQERIALEEEKKALEESKLAVEADKVEADSLRQTLAVQKSTAVAAVQDIATMETQYKADLAANQKKSEAMQVEIKNIYQQIQLSKNPYVGGVMMWPVPGYLNISSYYGLRFGNTDYHTGMDISGGGIYGKNVVAANAGTVRHVNWSHSPGRGYGIYIIVDHGGNMSTLYAHLSNISVQVGQEVAQGEVIGQIGSTGWSTGPHLHFEVREGSQHKNPLPYVKG